MDGVSRETQMSIAASSMFPGFRFSPTDIELISYYLKKKLEGSGKCVEVIPEVEICKFEPWDLPGQSIIHSDNEWFFFCARGRKYPNGSQSKRATELGYWKATGKERNVKSGSEVIGTKRTLVFHLGRAPKGERTEWIMHEYCMSGTPQDSLVVCRLRRNSEFRMNNMCNRASSSQGHSPTVPPPEVIRDLAGFCDGNKPAEYNPKKSSSSYDSHSIDQIDSTSESNQQIMNTLTESCSQRKFQDSDGEEDFYADILKDDIIKLDDSSTSAAPNLLPAVNNKSEAVASRVLPVQGSSSAAPNLLPAVNNKSEAERRHPQPLEAVASRVLPVQGSSSAAPNLLPAVNNKSEAERRHPQPLEAVASRVLHVQGSANRRIRLRKLKSPRKELKLLKRNSEDRSTMMAKISVTEQLPRRLLSKISATVNRHFVAVVFLLILLVFILSLLSDLPLVKRISYYILYKSLHTNC